MTQAWAWASALLLGCAGGTGQKAAHVQLPQSPLASRWHYEIRSDTAQRSLDATLCFWGPMPRALRANVADAEARLRYARWVLPGPARPLRIESGQIWLDDADVAEVSASLVQPLARRCLAYGVDLSDGGDLSALVQRLDSGMVASPNVWLWHPVEYAQSAQATLQFVAEEGASASLPWQRSNDASAHYQLDPESAHFDAHAAFGRLRRVTGEHLGVPFEAVVLSQALVLPSQSISEWMRSAIEVASLGPAGFPGTRLHVLMLPSHNVSEQAVSFGSVTRGGAGSVVLFVGRQATLENLRSDWVLPHELSHLFLPRNARKHAWFNEGAATYYQEVLRARAGVLSTHEALQNLARSMQRAARMGTGRNLRDESADMHRTHAYRPVYWGGAAFFLMADVALRRATDGVQTLDSVFRKLLSENAPRRFVALRDLLSYMDASAGVSVFVPLADTCLERSFPDVEPVLGALGAFGTLGDDAYQRAELAALRDAIFAPQPAPAARPIARENLRP